LFAKRVNPAQFENSPVPACAIISCIVNRELKNQFCAHNNHEIQAVSGVACWWITGRYTEALQLIMFKKLWAFTNSKQGVRLLLPLHRQQNPHSNTILADI
jgi:hypothetical protein